MHPTSSLFSRRRRPLLLGLPCLRRAVAAKEEERRLFLHNWQKRCVDRAQNSATGLEEGKTDKLTLEMAQMTLPPLVQHRVSKFFAGYFTLCLLFLANLFVGSVGYVRNFGAGFNSWFPIAKS